MAVTPGEFRKRIESIDQKAATAAFQSIGGEVAQLAVAGVTRSLKASKSPDGVPFQPLRRPRANGSKPLINTGNLLRSTTARMTGAELTIMNDAPGAALHNNGGTVSRKPRTGIPLTSRAKQAGSPKNYPAGLFAKTPAKKLQSKSPSLVRKGVVTPKREFLGVSDETAGEIAALYLDTMVKAVVSQLEKP